MPHLNGVVPPLLDDLQAQLTLHLACSKCSHQENESTYSLKEVEHRCMMEILLAKLKGKRSKLWRKIARRPSFPNPARYDVCRYYVAGQGCTKHRNRCTFAWSKEEMMVWTFERKHSMERHVLKTLVRQAQTGGSVNGVTKRPQPGVAEEILSEFGGHFQQICKACFYQIPSKISPRSPAQNCHEPWSPLLVHVIADGKMKEQYTEIRPYPGNLNRVSYCRYISAGKPCRQTALRCIFAHSDVEKEIWEVEQKGGLVRDDLLRPLADCSPGEQASGSGIQFYCRVCLVTCQSQESFENHCSSVEHLQLITTDTTTEWKHRAPPYGLKSFALCNRIQAASVCSPSGALGSSRVL